VKALRAPLARLLLGGVLLLAAAHVLGAREGPGPPARELLRVPALRIDEARRAFVAEAGRTPDASESAALIDAAVDEEVLYREALSRGLDATDPVVQQRLARNMAFVGARGAGADVDRHGNDALVADARALGMDTRDVVVRRRLVERMRALLEEGAASIEPSEDDLQRRLAAEPKRFVRPARVRLSQVVLRRDPHGEVGDASGAKARAAHLLAAGLPDPAAAPDEVARRGDPSPLPTHLPLQGEHDLARLFGAPFARTVLTLDAGTWRGPVSSAYGEHLVWVHERVPEEPLPLDAVRGEVRELVRSERARAALARGLAELRARYDVVVDDGAPGAPG